MAKRKIKATTVKQTEAKQKNKTSIWANIKFLFTTLFSNDKCVEARHKPWYTGIIIALASTAIATIPTMASYFNRSGADFFNAPNNGLDSAVVEFERALDENDVSMEISDGKMSVNQADWDKVCKDPSGTPRGFYGHYYTVTNIVLTAEESSIVAASESISEAAASSEAVPTIPTEVTITYCDLAVYFIDDAKLGDDSINTFTTATILASNDPNYSVLANTTVTTYTTNLIVFGEEGFVAYKKPNGAGTYGAAIQGKYDFTDAFDLKDFYNENMYGGAHKSNYGTPEHRQEVLEAYKGFFRASWENTKTAIAWQYTGIAFAINVALTLLFGFMIFLMTRGKNNPFHVYSFWDGQKIAYWATLAPAILSLLGFIPLLAQYAMFVYLFLMGMRVMWMSTKTLRPQYTQE